MLISPEAQPQSEESMIGERKEIFGPAIGALMAALAASGVVDDSGLLRHPWWAVLLGSIAVLGLLLGARTVQQLLNS